VLLNVLRASVVIKAPKAFHHGDTENTEKPVGRELKTLSFVSLFCFSLTSQYNLLALLKLNYNLPKLSRLASMLKLSGKGVHSWLFV